MERRHILSQAKWNENPWSHHVALDELARNPVGKNVQPANNSNSSYYFSERALLIIENRYTFVPPRSTAILTVVPFSALEIKPISCLKINENRSHLVYLQQGKATKQKSP